MEDVLSPDNPCLLRVLALFEQLPGFRIQKLYRLLDIIYGQTAEPYEGRCGIFEDAHLASDLVHLDFIV